MVLLLWFWLSFQFPSSKIRFALHTCCYQHRTNSMVGGKGGKHIEICSVWWNCHIICHLGMTQMTIFSANARASKITMNNHECMDPCLLLALVLETVWSWILMLPEDAEYSIQHLFQVHLVLAVRGQAFALNHWGFTSINYCIFFILHTFLLTCSWKLW